MPGPGSAEAIGGSLLGLAAGDALGLPYEGLSPRRAARLFGEPRPYRLFLGRGFFSDDTEHATLTAQALIESAGDVELFRKRLARRLRWWLAGLPAGVGFATLRSLLRLWIGVPPARSGVRSAGNGPAMRSPLLGAAVVDLAQLRLLVEASTRITHTDPRAEEGALVAALAARQAALGDPVPDRFLSLLASHIPAMDRELRHSLEDAAQSVERGESTPAFALSLGLTRGVSGFICHTVPAAVHAWWSHPADLPAALTAVVKAGGDTDTTAAITGGIVGAGVGPTALSGAWRDGIADWPRTLSWIESLPPLVERALSGPVRQEAPGLSPVFVLPRNVIFLAIVLAHGLRRLFPPY